MVIWKSSFQGQHVFDAWPWQPWNDLVWSFQDGWLSAKSARLYDYQVEALFLDTADTPPPPRSLTLPLRAPSPLARLYDYQVESLFLGTADAMRRQIMPDIAAFMRGIGPEERGGLMLSDGRLSTAGLRRLVSAPSAPPAPPALRAGCPPVHGPRRGC